MKHFWFLTFTCSLSFAGFCQTNLVSGSYVSLGPFGQPAIKYPIVNNFLYAATTRFGVTTDPVQPNLDLMFSGKYDYYTGPSVAAGTSMTITVDFQAKGGSTIGYAMGDVILHFYYQSIPDSVTGRIQDRDGVWHPITGWTNISTSVIFAVWKGAVPNFNYATKLELTVTARTDRDAIVSQLEYILTRSGFSPGVVTKFADNTLYKNLLWNDDNNALSAGILNNGTGYFLNKLGVGTSAPAYPFHIKGDNTLAYFEGSSTSDISLMVASGSDSRKANLTLRGSKTGTAHLWSLTSHEANGRLAFFNGAGVENLSILQSGNIGIGTIDPQAKLAVNGDVFAKKIKVTQSGWPDYVFFRDYPLMKIEETEAFIGKHKHLPGVPSAAAIDSSGLDLGQSQSILLQKIEELTLYLIDQNKRIKSQEQEIRALKDEMLLLKASAK